MESYELYIPPIIPRRKPRGFPKGNTPWNKGKTWEQQGLSEETKAQMLKSLEKGRAKKGDKRAKGKPVVCCDLQWNKLHRYKSVAEAARQVRASQTAIYQACITGRPKLGFCWKYENE